MSKIFVPYHVHTHYSLLDSCTKPKDYVELAVENGLRALSFSEHGKPLNWTEKWGLCKQNNLRYIHSVEIYLTEDPDEKVRDNYHTVLMARNMDGLRELNEIVSRSCQKDHFYFTNRISFDEFLALSPNIIATSACLASPLNKLDRSNPYYDKLVQRYDFLEIQAHDHPDQAAFNQRLYELSKQFHKPLIAGTDTHSSSPYKAECRSLILEGKHKTYGDEDKFDLTWKTYPELVDMFARQNALPESVYLQAIENTNALLDMTEEIELDTSIKYPISYGSYEEDAKVFAQKVEDLYAEKLESGVIPPEQAPAFRSAIDEEMDVFSKINANGFMLSMSELVSWCREQGMYLGPARGSVAGSRVAYITNIIDLNPETWHTVFSRFMNVDRVEIGDIDIDCIESDRPAIFEHIIQRFGGDKTARVASFGTLQARKVIEEVGRVFAARWEKEHPWALKKDNPWSLERMKKIKSDFDLHPDETREKYKELFYYYDGLDGIIVSQSIHPAGMVISPITLADNFGTFDKDGEICLMLDMDNVHDFTGLAKYDFLVLTTVQIIRDTCDYIGCPYPKSHEVDWNDQAVWSAMNKDPFGIFQMEGEYAHSSLRQFKPTSIFDMAIVTACIRPSGASYRDELLNRKPHHNPSAILDELLKDNLGYLIYQEDTIRFLQQICGLSGSAADTIRRGIARKKRELLDESLPAILDGYCAKSDKPREQAEQEAMEFIQVIEDSASYQFG